MKKYKIIIYALFVCYAALMIWLLFIQRIAYTDYSNYADNLFSNFNLIPFKTIIEYAATDISSESEILRHAFINLAGNIVMFIPLGFFLPLITAFCSELKKHILLTALIILIIELIQLFTLTGSFDIDDLILNIPGSIIGYGFQRLIFKNNH